MSAATAEATKAITITGPEPMIIDPTDQKRRPVLTPDEARLLTTEIQRTTSRLWLLVTEAHDRAAHFALGYETWNDYARAELGMSPSRSYQLLDTGYVMRELASVGVDIDNVKVPSARVVARIKDKLPEVRKAGAKAVKDGVTTEQALKELAKRPRRRSEPVKPTDGRKTALLTCPGCNGKGKVSRSKATKLRLLIKGSK